MIADKIVSSFVLFLAIIVAGFAIWIYTETKSPAALIFMVASAVFTLFWLADNVLESLIVWFTKELKHAESNRVWAEAERIWKITDIPTNEIYDETESTEWEGEINKDGKTFNLADVRWFLRLIYQRQTMAQDIIEPLTGKDLYDFCLASTDHRNGPGKLVQFGLVKNRASKSTGRLVFESLQDADHELQACWTSQEYVNKRKMGANSAASEQDRSRSRRQSDT